MKLFLPTMICLTLLVATGHCQEEKDAAKKDTTKKGVAKKDDGGLKTLSDKVSYGIGLNFGEQLSRSGLGADDVNPKIIVEAMLDVLGKKKHRITDAQLRAAFEELSKKKEAEAKKERKALTTRNKKEGVAYLAANGKKQGVTTTKSGLQYKIVKAGTGKTPKTTDRVKAHYRGTLIDGTVFDSSYKRGEPSVFPVTGVIKGWTEALQLMKVGAKWQLVIPAELAYGANPRPGGPIGPDAVLIFDIELVGIE